ncbi:hypothetical protein D3C73_724800 [compost metagenome]
MALLRGGAATPGLRGIAGGEAAFEHRTHFIEGVALEWMLRVVGDVQDQRVGVTVFFTDDEQHTADHPPLHQKQVTEPDLFLAHPRMSFTRDYRENHSVVSRLNVLLEQRQFGGGAHRGFLRVDEGQAQGLLRDTVGGFEEVLEVRLVLRTDVQRAAQLRELGHGQRCVDWSGSVRRFLHKPRGLVEGVGLGLRRFKVMQGGLQQRQAQHFVGPDIGAEYPPLQRLLETEQRGVDVQFDLELVSQRLDQQGLGKGVDGLQTGHDLVEAILRGKAGRSGHACGGPLLAGGIF